MKQKDMTFRIDNFGIVIEKWIPTKHGIRIFTGNQNKNNTKINYLVGGSVIRDMMLFGIKGFVFPVISCSSPVITNIMAIGGLHGR
jgi:hypothetical protein